MSKKTLYILFVFVILFFQNCATPIDTSPRFSTDPTFYPYIQEFESYWGRSTSKVPIAFADLPEDKAGVCYKTTLGSKTIRAYIKIDKEYWGKISEYQKINLIFHELGHCVLNREHVESTSVVACPPSFMDPMVLSTSCIQQHEEEYIKELFGG